MKYINTNDLKEPIDWNRKISSNKALTKKVKSIGLRVKEFGDDGIKQINQELKIKSPKSFLVKNQEILKASALLTDEDKNSILVAITNIKAHHEKQLDQYRKAPQKNMNGIEIWQEFRAIRTIGIYVPGGTAPLVSSLLMQLIPATLAGCKNINICTPPQANGKIHPAILWAAKQINPKVKIYKIGGAQAIFAMSNGTKSIPQVEKIFGPGNEYVNEAKKQISSITDIDLPAGPSEVMIVANDYKDPGVIALDLLSQLEHGTSSKAYVLSRSKKILDVIKDELPLAVKDHPRNDVLSKSIKNVLLIKTRSIKEQIKLINDCAPEHLILLDNNFSSFIPEVLNAGSIFCGPLTPVSFGDYASGTNHVLPTNGMAKTRSGLGLIDFGKVISFQYANQEGFNSLAPVVTNMANLEGLTAHAETVAVRKKQSQLTIRESFVIRRSKETEIFINLNLDGNGLYSIGTGINFLDHMLEQLSKHSGINLSVKCIGDTHIDEHHTIEDIAIALGSSINEALGDRKNINRYSSNFSVVMDECQSDCLIDLSSRSYLKYQTSKLREFVGDLPTEMVEHFFKSLVENAKFTCHLKTKGENTHHIVESSFKSFAKAFGEAIKLNSSGSSSTKGFL